VARRQNPADRSLVRSNVFRHILITQPIGKFVYIKSVHTFFYTVYWRVLFIQAECGKIRSQGGPTGQSTHPNYSWEIWWDSFIIEQTLCRNTPSYSKKDARTLCFVHNYTWLTPSCLHTRLHISSCPVKATVYRTLNTFKGTEACFCSY
jgi:hypothetical protein